jgi:hypothetical protein
MDSLPNDEEVFRDPRGRWSPERRRQLYGGLKEAKHLRVRQEADEKHKILQHAPVDRSAPEDLTEKIQVDYEHFLRLSQSKDGGGTERALFTSSTTDKLKPHVRILALRPPKPIPDDPDLLTCITQHGTPLTLSTSVANPEGRMGALGCGEEGGFAFLAPYPPPRATVGPSAQVIAAKMIPLSEDVGEGYISPLLNSGATSPLKLYKGSGMNVTQFELRRFQQHFALLRHGAAVVERPKRIIRSKHYPPDRTATANSAQSESSLRGDGSQDSHQLPQLPSSARARIRSRTEKPQLSTVERWKRQIGLEEPGPTS